MRIPILLLAASSLLFVARTSRAQPPGPAPTPSPAPAAAPANEETGQWGWLVLGTGILAGGALTAYGLTFDCDNDLDCGKRAGVAIWGGLGIAALTSAIGLYIVESGSKPVQVAPTVSGDRVGVLVRAAF